MTAVVDEPAAPPADPGTDVEVAKERSTGLSLGHCDVPRELAQMLQLAEVLANAATMPKHFRRVEDVVLVMMAAQALDVPVFWAIQAFHLVEGRLGMEATFMRSLLYRAGGDMKILEHTAQTASIRIRKPGAREWSDPVTVHHAEYKHLHGKNNWRDNPRAMVMARCTTTALRLYCPNVLMGFNYSPDELAESEACPVIEVTVTDRPRRGAATAGDAAAGRQAWLTAIGRARDGSDIARLRTQGAQKGLLDTDLDGMTLGARITARMQELEAEAAREAAAGHDDNVVDVEADDEPYDDGDPGDVEDAFPGQAPARPVMSCGCNADDVFRTGNHSPDCRQFTVPVPAADPRARGRR